MDEFDKQYREVVIYKLVKIFRTFLLVLTFFLIFASVSFAQSSTTYYLDVTNGSDNYTGTSPTVNPSCINQSGCSGPWQSLAKPVVSIKSGDTVILAKGIYREDTQGFMFGPIGTQGRFTTYKAVLDPSQPNGYARVIITGSDDKAHFMYLGGYTRLEGLIVGGIFDSTNSTNAAFMLTGNPYGNELVNNTFYGWFEGPQCGWCQNTLYFGNRFVNSGGDPWSHAMYLSSGTVANHDLSNHNLVDSNIIVGGLGYGLHAWHGTSSQIWSRNFVGGDAWGGADDGTNVLWLHDFFWKETGGKDPPWGPLLSYQHWLINNIFGPWGCPDTDGNTRPTATYDSNAWINNWTTNCFSPGGWSGPYGTNVKTLTSGQELAQIGISAGDLDNTIAALKDSFNQPATTIMADSTIEQNFAKIRNTTIPAGSPFKGTGNPVFGQPTDIGWNVMAPATICGFWQAFDKLGLTEYDQNGNTLIASQTVACQTGELLPLLNPNSTLTPTSPVPSPTPVGDINGDGKIDGGDLFILLQKYLTSDSLSDLNKDSKVNMVDSSILINNFGK